MDDWAHGQRTLITRLVGQRVSPSVAKHVGIEDVVQMIVVKHATTYDPLAGGSKTTWLYSCTNMICLEQNRNWGPKTRAGIDQSARTQTIASEDLKRVGTEGDNDLMFDPGALDQAFSEFELSENIGLILSLVRPRLREVAEYRMRGLTYKAIGIRMGVSESRVYQLAQELFERATEINSMGNLTKEEREVKRATARKVWDETRNLTKAAEEAGACTASVTIWRDKYGWAEDDQKRAEVIVTKLYDGGLFVDVHPEWGGVKQEYQELIITASEKPTPEEARQCVASAFAKAKPKGGSKAVKGDPFEDTENRVTIQYEGLTLTCTVADAVHVLLEWKAALQA